VAAPDDDFEARLTSTDAAAARVLAAGADHDVSEVRAELRAHTQGLNALRETQLEQGGEMAVLRRGLAEQGREMHEGFGEMRGDFATVTTGMAQITALLTNIAGQDPDDS